VVHHMAMERIRANCKQYRPILLLFIFAASLLLACSDARNGQNKLRSKSKVKSAQPSALLISEKEKMPRFAIAPLGNIKVEHIQLALSAVQNTYRAEAVLLHNSQMPSAAYVKSRDRWRADDLLIHLNQLKDPLVLKIIGLTDEDICTKTEKSPTWGIFGLGALDGAECVISTWRLGARSSHPEFPVRLEKVVVHEIGHTFGLNHCPTKGCIMEDACGSIKTVDREIAFCPACQKLLGKDFKSDSK
jgi:archaemetzincin